MKSATQPVKFPIRFWNKLHQSWQFAIKAFLIVRLFYALWSWVVLTVQPIAVHYVDIADKPGVSFLNLYTVKAYTYVREIGGSLLTFRPIDKNMVMDLQTGSRWNIYSGEAIEGKYQGFKLIKGNILSDEMFPYYDASPYPNAWLALWQRFDANWYISIAEHGYGAIQGDFVFPPLFPLLILLLKPFFGYAFLAGLFISNLATFFALKLLYDLFIQWGDRQSAHWALIFFLLYPTFFFMFSVYTESLFLVLALLALHFMRSREWHWAGFWIFCAILARLQGIALLVPLIYLMWKEKPFLHNLQHWAGLMFAGFGFLFYFYMRFANNQSGIVLSELMWHSHFVFPWESYFYAVQFFLTSQVTYIDILNWAITTLFIILLIWGWQKIPPEYSLYNLSSLLVMLARLVETKPLNAMLRYTITIFPVFYILGSVNHSPWKRRIIIYTFIALNLYLSQEFFSWGWVA